MKRKIILLIIVVFLIQFSFINLYGQDEIDEDTLFSDSESIKKSEDLVDENINAKIESESLTFSGSMFNSTGYMKMRDDYALKRHIAFIKKSGLLSDADIEALETLAGFDEGNRFYTDITGIFNLDVRLTQGVKGFINFDLEYNPVGTEEIQTITADASGDINPQVEKKNTLYLLKEFFIDANIKRMIYFRIGKQVLKWGRNYFWNPTDLISIDKKNFQDMDYNREGIYGLKVHVPFGTAINFYSFIDANDAEKIEDLACAGKLEFLLGNTEAAISMWTRKKRVSVYGFDFSSRIATIDIRGEMSLSYGENRRHLEESEINGIPTYTKKQITNEWIPKVSLGFSRSFDFMDVNDRIMIIGEFFYNHSGYDENVFNDSLKTMFLLMNNMYDPNYHSKYYAAVFISIQKFLLSDLSFTPSVVNNISDQSYIALVQLVYNPVYDFTLAFTGTDFIGDDDREYTFIGNDFSVQLEARLMF